MIEVTIPGFKNLALEHLVLDFNGTLAVDGRLLPGVFNRLRKLAALLDVHVITADTFGQVRQALEGLEVDIRILAGSSQAEAKRAFVEELGAGRVVAIGNGRNDRLMLQAAALGIAVASAEGSATSAMAAAHVHMAGILDAFDLLGSPLRLTATLRD